MPSYALIASFALIAIGVLIIGIRARRYGGLRASFSSALSADRKRLAEARKALGAAEKLHKRELKEANKALADQQAAYDSRVAEARDYLRSLENPGTGSTINRLGQVELHQHAVTIRGETMDLLGLEVDTKVTEGSAMLLVTQPSGYQASCSFDTRWRSTGNISTKKTSGGDYDVITASEEMTRSFSPESVVELSVQIRNQAINRRAFVEALPTAIPKAREALRVAEEDTGALQEAAAHLSFVETEGPTAVAMREAAEGLDDVESEYATALANAATT